MPKLGRSLAAGRRQVPRTPIRVTQSLTTRVNTELRTPTRPRRSVCRNTAEAARKPKTNGVPPHCRAARGFVPIGRPAAPTCEAAWGFGAGGVRVNEVTRDASSAEEVSGRREAAKNRADRGDD